VFLVYVGVQHAAFIRDIISSKALLSIAACVGIVSLLMTNLTYGFVAGFLLQGVLMLFHARSAGVPSEAP
jgi:hypothetical protein